MLIFQGVFHQISRVMTNFITKTKLILPSELFEIREKEQPKEQTNKRNEETKKHRKKETNKTL